MTVKINADSAVNQGICGQLVNREVVCCVSSLVSHFANNSEALDGSDYSYDDDIIPLLSKDDWDEPLEDHVNSMDRDDVIELLRDDFGIDSSAEEDTGTLREALLVNIRDEEQQQDYCDQFGIDPYQNEALEHWAVSSWFAEKLEEQGEIVGELFDLRIWGRCTSGQSIYIDGVIQRIAADMEILEGQANDWSKR